MKGRSQELEYFFFYDGHRFHLRHVAVYGFDQRIHNVKIPQFVMRKQMQQSCIALNVVSQVYIVIDDSSQVVNAGCIVAASKV